jgi:hypothetical protein
MIEYQNTDNFSTGGSYGGKNPLTISSIIMNQIQKIANAGSVEFKGGFWQSVIVGNSTSQVYVNNTRDAYTNGIKTLRSMLLVKFDDEMKAIDESLAKEEKQKRQDIKAKYSKIEEGNDAFDLFSVGWHRRLFESLLALCDRKNYWGVKDKTEHDKPKSKVEKDKSEAKKQ